MKRTLELLLVLLITTTVFAGCSSQTGGDATANASPSNAAEASPEVSANMSERTDFSIIDMAGRKVDIPASAQSFACIGPGCLRLYCYAADTSKLVGIEETEKDITGRPYMMINSDLTSLTVIGPGGPNNAPDAEKLLVAAPDVIFTTYNSDISAIDELQAATGIPVVALSYGTTAIFDVKVDQSLELIGQITQHEERAAELVDYFASLKEDLTGRTANIADESKPTIYMGAQSMKGTHGIESTSGNYEIFNVLGAKNVVDEAGIHEYTMLDKEALIEMDPDVIIIDAAGYSLVLDDYVANKDFYGTLSAVKNGKVYLQMPYNSYSTNIEVALADAYYIGSVLYPEQFSDIDIEAKFDEITEKMLGAEVYSQFSQTYFGGYQQVNFGT